MTGAAFGRTAPGLWRNLFAEREGWPGEIEGLKSPDSPGRFKLHYAASTARALERAAAHQAVKAG